MGLPFHRLLVGLVSQLRLNRHCRFEFFLNYRRPQFPSSHGECTPTCAQIELCVLSGSYQKEARRSVRTGRTHTLPGECWIVPVAP